MLTHQARQNLRHQIDQHTRTIVFADPICPHCSNTFPYRHWNQIFCTEQCRKQHRGPEYRRLAKERARQTA